MDLQVGTGPAVADAWSTAHRLLDDLDAETVAAAQAALGRSESVGRQRMLALRTTHARWCAAGSRTGPCGPPARRASGSSRSSPSPARRAVRDAFEAVHRARQPCGGGSRRTPWASRHSVPSRRPPQHREAAARSPRSGAWVTSSPTVVSMTSYIRSFTAGCSPYWMASRSKSRSGVSANASPGTSNTAGTASRTPRTQARKTAATGPPGDRFGSHPRTTKRPCCHASALPRSPDQEPCSTRPAP